ncbi:hypothetical protein ACEN2T_18125 [Pseudomonas sp. W22_MBD1_FP4]|uniref:hypothetical protein n=1 Tax=Pseudomonas sp. W22_MBD1_FP4 TaxID=3240272 RepID=UPI003F9CF7F2
MATPKRQPYPASRIKVGAVLYRAYSTFENGKAKTGFEEWIVRNIRARRNSKTICGVRLAGRGIVVPKVVNLAMKTFGTWGKLSGKAGDFGWLPNIWSGYRRQFKVGADLPLGIYTTKRAALAFELAEQVDQLASLTDDIAKETDPEELLLLKAELPEIAAQVAALRRRAKALINSKANLDHAVT